jgi:hypothetical protein
MELDLSVSIHGADVLVGIIGGSTVADVDKVEGGACSETMDDNALSTASFPTSPRLHAITRLSISSNFASTLPLPAGAAPSFAMMYQRGRTIRPLKLNPPKCARNGEEFVDHHGIGLIILGSKPANLLSQMWNLGLSDLAQTAKDALARIETTINESVGLDGEDDDDNEEDDKVVMEGELARGVVTVTRDRAPTSEGWSMADGSASLDDSGGDNSSGVNVEKESQISDSFVDLKAMDDISPKDDERGLQNNNTALMDALAQIESLQLLVASLREELTLAKAEKVMLENQIKELQEENKNSKR